MLLITIFECYDSCTSGQNEKVLSIDIPVWFCTIVAAVSAIDF